MDDQNKKNPYDDFFGKRTADGGSSSGEDQTEPQESGSAAESVKPSYYYSYGPFKSTPYEEGQPPAGRPDDATAERRTYPAPAQQGVEITPSTPPAPYAPVHAETADKAKTANWQVREKRRTSFRAMFASFMAGVIVIGGLMVASDRLDWFSGDQALAVQSQAGGGGEAATAAGSGGTAPVANAIDVVRPNNIAKVFEQSSPAVVKIETYVQGRSSSSGSSLFDDPFFRQFFGEELPTPKSQGQSNQLVPSGLGSGFFFDKTGYILTNQHVIGDSDQIKVTVQGYDQPLDAKLLGSSYELDLAVLKVESDKDFPTLALGNSDTINVGDWVVAIGNPSGFDHTVTVGVLSAKERPISIPDSQGTRNYEHLLQTDASINPGNSGGPLINLSGEVIGINTAVSTQSQGIGFAIPTSTIKEVLEHLKKNEEIPKQPIPFIGASLGMISEEIAQQLGLSDTNGSIVANITYNSPAYKADLRQYDVITGMDGEKYNNMQELIAAIQKKKVGDQVTLDVIRGGKAIELPVTIGNKNDFNLEQ